MSIVLTCGYRHSGYDAGHSVLVSAGLVAAKRSRQELISPVELTQKTLAASGVKTSDLTTIGQIAPGKVWQALSVDLMLANMDQPHWGWADPNLIYLLDYWRDFDPNVAFCLVYSSPQFAVARMMASEPARSEAPQQSIAHWSAYNAELLRFYNANRNRAILVNADALLSDVREFVAKCRDSFDLDFGAPVLDICSNEEVDAIARLGASVLVSGADYANMLYEELESVADLPLLSQRKQEPASMACHAWAQHCDYRQRLDHADERAGRLLSERDRLRQENELLLLQLQQVQEELEQVSLRATDAERSLEVEAAKCREIALKVQQYFVERDALKSRLTELQSRHANPSAESEGVARLQAKLEEAGKENELLLLQLHQVQEELEHYFLKYQELSKKQDSKTEVAIDVPLEAPDHKLMKSETVIDLRQFIDGENWHHAEHDGRWAGPGTKSTIRLPALPRGRYHAQLDVVGVMAPEIIGKMQLRIGGQAVKIRRKTVATFRGALAPLKRAYVSLYKRNLICPLVAWGEFEVDDQCADRPLTLELTFPRTISPTKFGEADWRELAIRVGQIKITPR